MAGRSTYSATCWPGAIVIGITRGSPLPRSSMRCDPASSCSVTGVLPRRTPSTNASAPAGFVVTTSVPVVGGVGTSLQNRRAPTSATALIVTTATAATAATFAILPPDRRAGLGESVASNSKSSSSNVAFGISTVSLFGAVFDSTLDEIDDAGAGFGSRPFSSSAAVLWASDEAVGTDTTGGVADMAGITGMTGVAGDAKTAGAGRGLMDTGAGCGVSGNGSGAEERGDDCDGSTTGTAMRTGAALITPRGISIGLSGA